MHVDWILYDRVAKLVRSADDRAAPTTAPASALQNNRRGRNLAASEPLQDAVRNLVAACPFLHAYAGAALAVEPVVVAIEVGEGGGLSGGGGGRCGHPTGTAGGGDEGGGAGGGGGVGKCGENQSI